MHQIGAAPRELRHIEPFSDRELLEQDVALRYRGLAENRETAIRDARGPRPVGAVGGEVVRADRAARLRDRGGEALGELTAVERRGAGARDLAKRHGKLGLLQDFARAREAATRPEHARGAVVEARAAVHEALRESVAHRKTLVGVLDRRRQIAIESKAPVI